MIRFEPNLVEIELLMLNPELLEIIGFFCSEHLVMTGTPATITSMLRIKTTDSGVHQTGRAIDMRSTDLSPTQINEMVVLINSRFVRTDGHNSAIYHDVGEGFHFHLQVPYSSWWASSEAEILSYLTEHKPTT